MEKKRVEFGKDYYFIDITTQIHCGCELHSGIESKLFDAGNYFATKGEAEACVRKLRAVLNGADVIDMPSEEEIHNSCNQYIEQDNEPRYGGCLNKGHYFEGWLACIEWLKSKIIK